MHLYRVWYDDGSSTIIAARNPAEARKLAHQKHPRWKINKVELFQ